MAPKHRSREAGNLDLLKKRHEMLFLSKKVKVINLIKKEKRSCAEAAKIYGKNEKVVPVLLLQLKFGKL
jgi:hypothetical protein